ncbi:type I secretion system, outer membrane component LapE [Caldimonas brevitalea]|uniref:Type I secretion system, outer membrane component LapE n=1 Tax=Caldimonas brevitalea TaxID=413882 RepID=A0A0G3BJQ3_9BURK|nr:type I secretion system, outer membrane component LapE [Caldimonas brevitalea]
MLASLPAAGQSSPALQTAARQALDSNPELGARLHAWTAARHEVGVARGGYLPRLDLTASGGRDRDKVESRTPEKSSLSRTGASLSVTQMLWDGGDTRSEVQRLGHAGLSRYFEFTDAAQQTALEAVRAYYDVARFRRLVELAEDNYVQHKASHDQIQARFRAGVSRGVDLEQAAARLALAESNLSTEIANLHDVSARYQRIVGQLPPASVELPQPLQQGLPVSAASALETAVARSGAVSAAIENLRAVRWQLRSGEATYQPRLEARLRSGFGHNYESVPDQRRDTSAELLLTWNLYNGGSDHARVRQLADLAEQAAALRDKACRDTRQTTTIAYNDTQKLVDQLRFLDANQLAIEKARDAYRKQFDIGQRSLLDLLNSENELYTARRAYANAEYDLGIAYARVHAAAGTLLSTLGITAQAEPPPEAQGWAAGEDQAARCPAAGPEVLITSKSQLDARAHRLSNAAPALPPGVLPGTAPQTAPTAPAGPGSRDGAPVTTTPSRPAPLPAPARPGAVPPAGAPR